MLAVDRTRLAHERTLMAWVRTSTSMISFGFTIYKFFEGQPPRGQRTGFLARLLDARSFAVLLISMALLALLLAAIQNRQEMNALRARYVHVPRSNAMTVTMLVAFFGVFAFVAVLLGPLYLIERSQGTPRQRPCHLRCRIHGTP